MPDLTLGTNVTYDGASKTRSEFATAVNTITESTGSLILDRGTKFDNSDGLEINDAAALEYQTISTNTEGPYAINSSNAAFGTSVTINSGVYLWSDSTSSPALQINAPCAVINNGYIIGRGGDGGTGEGGNGGAGGPAIKINSGVTGVTITNNSGAYIAGGGGGGGAQGDPTDTDDVPGGGGAGGGSSGSGYNTGSYAGGAIGQPGNGGGGFPSSTNPASPGDHQGYGGQITAQDGGAGDFSRPTSGGRNITGTNYGNAATGGDVRGGAGGFWGQVGQNGIGSASEKGSGGAAGKAIDDSGVTYTLTNNGTVYGVT